MTTTTDTLTISVDGCCEPTNSDGYTLSGDACTRIIYLRRLPFWREDPRSPHERTRLRSGRGALVVVDHSGAVVVQGTNKQQTQRQLARFVKEQGVLLWQR